MYEAGMPGSIHLTGTPGSRKTQIATFLSEVIMGDMVYTSEAASVSGVEENAEAKPESEGLSSSQIRAAFPQRN